jgi:hypothetical protein
MWKRGLQLLQLYPIISSFQIDEFAYPVGKPQCESIHLIARDRMTDEIDLANLQGVFDTQNVFDETWEIITIFGLGRSSETAARKSENVIVPSELGSKVVEDMCGIAVSCKQENWLARSPVEDF